MVTSVEAEDAVAELLSTSTQAATSSHTDAETRRTTVSAYVEVRPDWRRLRSELQAGLKRIQRAGLNFGAGTISLGRVPKEDWATSWKRHFRPLFIGRSLVVKPGWIRVAAVPGRAVVVLDPGLSFGTGQHPTTAFCLEQLVKWRTKIGEPHGDQPRPTSGTVNSFLDIGTGSGILAIAAAKLGYERVDAFDFDPEAIRVAADNLRRNRVKIRLWQQDVTKLPKRPAVQYRVICANLIGTLLIEQRDKILARVVPGGVVVLAGILAEEFERVRRHYARAGWLLIDTRKKNEWQSGSFQASTKARASLRSSLPPAR